MKNKIQTVTMILSSALIIYLIIFYDSSLKAAFNGLTLWVENVLCVLFPMLVVSRYMILSKAAYKISRFFSGAAKKIFGLGEGCAFAYVSSIISGYPAGTKTVCDMYSKKMMNKRDAFVLLCLCSNSSAIFLISTVGVIFFKSIYIGLIILISNYISAFISGLTASLLYPANTDKRLFNSIQSEAMNPFSAFSDAVGNAAASVINIGAYIVFFSVIIDAADKLMIFMGINSESFLNAFITGFFEVTAGAEKLANHYSANPALSVAVCCAFASFGGLCIFFQSVSFISHTDLSADKFFVFKLFQGVTAGITAFFLYKITFRMSLESFAPLHNPYSSGDNALLFSLITVIIVLIWIAIELVKYARIGKRNTHNKGRFGSGGGAFGKGEH